MLSVGYALGNKQVFMLSVIMLNVMAPIQECVTLNRIKPILLVAVERSRAGRTDGILRPRLCRPGVNVINLFTGISYDFL